MKIYTSVKWVFLSLAILLICSHSHANQTPFRTHHRDYQLLNTTHYTKSKHTQMTKLTYPVVIAGVLCFVAASISNAGGIGGGGLFIPILILVARLDLKTASTYSAFMVTGGSSANVMYHMISASPKYGAQSFIDYDICFLSEPFMLLGVSIGVMCNIMFPEWLITILCSVFLAWSTFKTFKCGVGKWKLETEERKEGCGERENGLVGIGGNCGGNGVEIDKEISTGLSGNAGELESSLVVGHDGNLGGNGLEINKEICLSGELVESCKQGIQWKKLGGLMVIWFSFFVLRLVTGNRHGQGITLVKPCEVGYWILSSMQIPLALSFTTWILYKRGSLHFQHQTSNHQEKEDQTRGERRSRELIFPVIALLAGFLGGVFGIGGGMLISPFFLQLGIAPEVAAATCALLVLFSSSMSAIQYFLLGMDHQHVYGALTLAFICFSASLIGLMVLKKAIKTYCRASLIVFIVAIVIALSTVMITIFGALNGWREHKSGRHMGFNRLCQQGRS